VLDWIVNSLWTWTRKLTRLHESVNTKRTNMDISQTGIDLIKSFESCRLHTYLDSVGVPTNGWGNTGPGVVMGRVITQQQADDTLSANLAKFEIGVNNLVSPLAVTQSQFDALVSFAFNLGLGALGGSTLLKKLRAGDTTGAANQFLSWCHAGGKEMPGLLRRRVAERDLFNTKEAV